MLFENKNLIKRFFSMRGFTLMEIMVGMVIIAIMSSLAIANFHGYSDTRDLSAAAQSVANLIREAQNNALSLKKFDGQFEEGGWGVFARNNATEISLFVDKDDNQECNSSCNGDEKARTLKFSENIEVDDIIVAFGNPNRMNLIYQPPDPKVLICTNINCNSTELTLRLRSTKNGQTKDIKLNFFGLVDID